MSSGLAPSFHCLTTLGGVVAGSIRQTVPSPLHATQTEPKPIAIAVGPSPTLIGVCERVVGSIRVTTSSPSLAIQTAWSPTATSTGTARAGKRKRSTMSFVSGSMRSRPRYFVVTQVASEPAAIAVAKSSSRTLLPSGASVLGSRRVRLPSLPPSVQMVSLPSTSGAPYPAPLLAGPALGVGIDLGQVAVRAVSYPHVCDRGRVEGGLSAGGGVADGVGGAGSDDRDRV